MVIKPAKAEHTLLDERWAVISEELRALKPKGVSVTLPSVRNQIEFLRGVALVNSSADTSHTAQRKAARARISRARKHLAKARLELKPRTRGERHYILELKRLEGSMREETEHRKAVSKARDNLIEDLILAWQQWGGRISASFQGRGAGGPLVRFLVASVGDIFDLTENAARQRIQQFKKHRSRQLVS